VRLCHGMFPSSSCLEAEASHPGRRRRSEPCASWASSFTFRSRLLLVDRGSRRVGTASVVDDAWRCWSCRQCVRILTSAHRQFPVLCPFDCHSGPAERLRSRSSTSDVELLPPLFRRATDDSPLTATTVGLGVENTALKVRALRGSQKKKPIGFRPPDTSSVICVLNGSSQHFGIPKQTLSRWTRRQHCRPLPLPPPSTSRQQADPCCQHQQAGRWYLCLGG